MTEPVYVALDLELTGLKPGRDEIIEVGIVRCTPEKVLERWSSLVRPRQLPPLRVQRMTGITPAMLADAPSFAEVEGEMRRLLEGAALIGHNIAFDEEFLAAVGIRTERPSVDTLPLAQIINPAAPSHRLADLCKQYQIDVGGFHRAEADAEASRQLLLRLGDEFQKLPDSARVRLASLCMSAGMLWAPGVTILDWSRQADRSVVAPAGRLPRSLPQAVRSLTRRPQTMPAVESNPLPPHYASDPIAIAMPRGSLMELTERVFIAAEELGLERRDEQIAMARDVAQALQRGDTAIVEAGTGTGKSLAYLIPAALWALKTGARVVVSTHTINLQHQLLEHEIAMARRLIARIVPAAEALNAAVVKGRGNYLCRRNLLEEREAVVAVDDALLLARATVWEAITETGDREELRLPAHEFSRWKRLSAEQTFCMSDGCDFVADGTCFVSRMRGRADESHLIVVNHALLLTDLVYGTAALPPAPAVIVDEAHALEAVATNVLSLTMDESWLNETLERVWSEGRGGSGVAQRAEAVVANEARQLRRRVQAIGEATRPLFAEMRQFARLHSQDSWGGNDRVTLTDVVRETPDWSKIRQLWESTARALGEAHNALEVLHQACQEQLADAGDMASQRELTTLTIEARQLANDLNERIVSLRQTVEEHAEGRVAWVRREQDRSSGASLNVAPLNVTEHLKPLWTQRHAVLLTGATLSTDATGFSFLREQLGIPDSAEAVYGSSFDYRNRCRLYLPVDAVNGNADMHDLAVARNLPILAEAAQGRTMVLFRSYRSMREVTKLAESQLNEVGLELVIQGRDGSPARIVDALRRDPRTVVFGVSSLWTGVDLPGDALSLLIVTKLPFVPPTDPVLKARAEQYENEFEEFSLPAAILQFRQGFGRLLRSATDRGAVVVLDRRITSQRYGTAFLRALPPAPVSRIPTVAVAEELRRFLPPPRTSQ